MLYKWNCSFYDNGGKKQFFVVSASDKDAAIKKAFQKAEKNARGDITSWNVSLRPSF